MRSDIVDAHLLGVLSPSGVQYHIDYLTGAKEKYGLEFEYIGIWNEAPWTKDYILGWEIQCLWDIISH